MNKLQRLVAQAIFAGLLLGIIGTSLFFSIARRAPAGSDVLGLVGLLFAIVMLVLVIIQTVKLNRP